MLSSYDAFWREGSDMGVLTAHTRLQDVVAYFDRKTQGIMRRYGPGPRVHYHAGLVSDAPPLDASEESLRRHLVDAQERMLWHAAKLWDAPSTLRADVLDVGCGLGGGAIFWAQEFGAQVTAVTCVPSHVEWVARLAERAGVGSHVVPVLCDATELPGANLFDAAVAIDSSGYLPRRPWLRRLSSLLRPGGRIFIADCFLAQPEGAEAFDSYWHTRTGTIDEYLTTACDEGLQTDSVEDVSKRTVHFWTTTLALIQAEMQDRTMGPTEMGRAEASLRAHTLVRDGLMNGSLRYALMSFSKGR